MSASRNFSHDPAAGDIAATGGRFELRVRGGQVALALAVADRRLADGLAFYRDVLGFEVQANLGSAAFVSAGGYHHHLGFNLWRGHGVGPAPAHTAGLRHWTIVLPTAADVAEVRARVTQAEDVDGGFLVRDPGNTAVTIRSAP